MFSRGIERDPWVNIYHFVNSPVIYNNTSFLMIYPKNPSCIPMIYDLAILQ